MADHIKYAVSCDVIDEYTTTNTASNDQGNDVADATISYSRHHPTVKKTLGGSVTANTTATEEWNAAEFQIKSVTTS